MGGCRGTGVLGVQTSFEISTTAVARQVGGEWGASYNLVVPPLRGDAAKTWGQCGRDQQAFLGQLGGWGVLWAAAMVRTTCPVRKLRGRESRWIGSLPPIRVPTVPAGTRVPQDSIAAASWPDAVHPPVTGTGVSSASVATDSCPGCTALESGAACTSRRLPRRFTDLGPGFSELRFFVAEQHSAALTSPHELDPVCIPCYLREIKATCGSLFLLFRTPD